MAMLLLFVGFLIWLAAAAGLVAMYMGWPLLEGGELGELERWLLRDAPEVEVVFQAQPDTATGALGEPHDFDPASFWPDDAPFVARELADATTAAVHAGAGMDYARENALQLLAEDAGVGHGTPILALTPWDGLLALEISRRAVEIRAFEERASRNGSVPREVLRELDAERAEIATNAEVSVIAWSEHPAAEIYILYALGVVSRGKGQEASLSTLVEAFEPAAARGAARLLAGLYREDLTLSPEAWDRLAELADERPDRWLLELGASAALEAGDTERAGAWLARLDAWLPGCAAQETAETCEAAGWRRDDYAAWRDALLAEGWVGDLERAAWRCREHASRRVRGGAVWHEGRWLWLGWDWSYSYAFPSCVESALWSSEGITEPPPEEQQVWLTARSVKR